MASACRLVIVWILACALCRMVQGDPSGQYANCKWLSGAPAMYRVWWTVDTISTPNTIHLAIEANSTGWMGLGLSTDGTMGSSGEGSDIFVAYMKDDGISGLQPYIRDNWTIERTKPTLDEHQNIAFFASNRNGTFTTFEFGRNLATGDNNQDRSINLEEKLYFIWAVHPTDAPMGVNGTMFSKHLYKGSSRIDWNALSTCSANPPTTNTKSVTGNKWTSEDGDFSLEWTFDDATNEIEISMSAQTKGWVAVGFSDSPSMPNADTIVGWVDDTTRVATLLDMWIGPTRTVPKLDTDLEGTNDVILVSASQKLAASSDNTEFTTLVFRRQLMPLDIYDMGIFNRDIYVLWAYGNSDGVVDEFGVPTFDHHSDEGLIYVNFYNNDSSADIIVDELSRHTTLTTSHGMLMIFAWPLLIVAGSFGARYIKPITQYWWPIHYILQIGGSVLSVLAVLVVAYDIGTAGEHFDSPHALVGGGITVGTLAQIGLGWYANVKFVPKRAEVPVFPDKIHWYLGRGLMVIATLNVLLGMHQYRLIGYSSTTDSNLASYKALGLFIVGVYTVWLIVAVGAHALGEWSRRKMLAAGGKIVAPFVVGISEDTTVAAESPAVELDDLDGEPGSANKSNGSASVIVDSEEIRDAGIKVLTSSSSSTKNAGSSGNMSSGSDASLASRFIAFAQRHRLFSLVMISHLVLLLSVTVAISLIPNDVDELPFQICPNCTERKFTFDSFLVPVGLHAYARNYGIENDTSYVCRGFDFGDQETFHIVQMDPIISNSEVVHHMILYALPYDTTADGYFDCLSMPGSAQPIYGWAPGMTSFILPQDAGFKAGKDSDARYLALQIHYDNPTLNPSQVDSSGVIMKMTKSLRKYDAGILFTGTDMKSLRIPPHTPEYEISGNCSNAETTLLPYALNVFASAPHAHKTGRMIWTEQWRDGKRIDVLNPEWQYSFNDQKFQPTTKVIEPGDELVTHCVYDTTDRDEWTVGGDATSNEMCLNVLAYYPKLDSYFCQSTVTVWDVNDGHWRPGSGPSSK